jgi:hypothetical protein
VRRGGLYPIPGVLFAFRLDTVAFTDGELAAVIAGMNHHRVE